MKCGRYTIDSPNERGTVAPRGRTRVRRGPGRRRRHGHRAHHRQLVGLRPGDRAPLPLGGVERDRHDADPARRRPAPLGPGPRARARRDRARVHRGRARGERPDRRPRQQRGHRGPRRVRGHAHGRRARDPRDQHLRRDGDDAGRAAPVPRAAVRGDRERDLERHAGPDAVGGRLRREQDGHRRVHRVARARARGNSASAPSWSSPATARGPASRATGRPACRG